MNEQFRPLTLISLDSGKANEQNFPKVNDYRNIVVAEGMKVLGFVNRHSRGVQRVQRELKANENGEAEYDFSYQTAVMVKEMKLPLGEQALQEAIAKGFVTENGEKQPNMSIFGKKQPQKQPNLSVSDENETQKESRLTISDFPTMLTWNVFESLKMNRKAKYSWLADNLGVSERTIQRAIDDLKELGYINKEHSKIKGEWQLLK